MNSADLDERVPRPVFILSPGRTGTTLVMRLLATSDEVLVPGAFPLEERLLSLVSLVAQLASSPGVGAAVAAATRDPGLAKPFGGDILNLAAHVRRVDLVDERDHDLASRLAVAIWDTYCRSRGFHQRYYAEKSVGLALPPGADAFEPLTLHVIRDPRDIVVSVREFNRKRGFAGFAREVAEPDADYAGRLMNMYRIMLESATPEALGVDEFCVRYEDLVLTPDAVAGRLGSWLGIRLDPRAVEAAGDHATSIGPADSVGRWRHELDEPTQRMFRRDLGALLDAHGYQD